MSVRMLRLLHYLVRWGGLAAMALGIYLFASHTVFFATAETATGSVVGQLELRRPSESYQGQRAYAPFIAYEPASGDEVTFLADSGFGKQFAFHYGDAVPVIYHRDDPRSARVYSLFELFGLPVIVFILGGAFWLCGVFAQLFAEQKQGRGVATELSETDDRIATRRPAA